MMRCVRGDMVGRTDELGAIDWFLDAVESGPAGLIIEGEPGIGKTTLWLQAADRAAARGMVVLSASGAVAEVTLTFAGLADLLDGVAPDVLAELDPAQQDALGRVSSGGEGPGANERLVAMAFGSALDRLSQSQPVILAVDDIQWLDARAAEQGKSRASVLRDAVAAYRARPAGNDWIERGSGYWQGRVDTAASPPRRR